MIPAARPAIALLACILLTACAGTHSTSNQPPIEATSLLSEPLRRPPLTDDQHARFTANLARAKWVFDTDPTNEMNIIWYARRLGYLGRYNEAIVATPSWPAFGHIAAEADLAHLRAQQADHHRPEAYEETARRVHDVQR